MKIHVAKNSDTAIRINVKENEQSNADYQIDKHVENIFGGLNGDYFVLNSRIMEDFAKKRTFKVIYVEDKDGAKHSLFFELIKENKNGENPTGPQDFISKSRYV